MKTGIELIAAERERQITAEGYTAAHDDQHKFGELAVAGICYADISGALIRGAPLAAIKDYYCDCTAPIPQWPFEDEEWKPSDDVLRNLAKAGAFIAAQMDIILRHNVERSHRRDDAGESPTT